MDTAHKSSESLRKIAETHIVGPWLATKLVDDLLPAKRVVICVSSTDSLADAYRTLIQHKIQSAPVYDMKAKEYTSLVDINDILAATILMNEQRSEGQQIAALLLRYLKVLEYFWVDIKSTLLTVIKDADKPDPDVATLLSTENLFKNMKVNDIASKKHQVCYS